MFNLRMTDIKKDVHVYYISVTITVYEHMYAFVHTHCCSFKQPSQALPTCLAAVDYVGHFMSNIKFYVGAQFVFQCCVVVMCFCILLKPNFESLSLVHTTLIAASSFVHL